MTIACNLHFEWIWMVSNSNGSIYVTKKLIVRSLSLCMTFSVDVCLCQKNQKKEQHNSHSIESKKWNMCNHKWCSYFEMINFFSKQPKKSKITNDLAWMKAMTVRRIHVVLKMCKNNSNRQMKVPLVFDDSPMRMVFSI